jgi:fructose-bisphosphate aldolase, class II
MRSLRQAISDFRATGKAIGHFNFSDSNQLMAIAHAARDTKLPVIAGLSEGEREFFPFRHARALVDIYQSHGIEIYLNADHTYSLEKAKDAIDHGIDSIVIDGAAHTFEENVKLVEQVVAYAHRRKRFFHPGKEVLVEGELGYIGMGSELRDALPEGVTEQNLTTAADAKKFVEETGINCFAPAVGNIHGMLKNAAEPRLHPDRVKDIAQAVGIPLVLHGASGNTEDDIRACIKAGVAVVHINTELRVLYRDTLRETLKTEETTPYKFLTPSVEKMQAYLMEKMQVFAGQ